MQSTQVLPHQFMLSKEINLMQNKKALIWVNVFSVVAFIVFGAFFVGIFLLLRGDDYASNLGTAWSFGLPFTLLALLGLLVVQVAVVVVHEALHGLFFWLYSGSKPKYGFRGVFAYASAPGWYFARNAFLMIGLAPLVIISAFGVLFIWLMPLNTLVWAMLFVVLNAAGAVGDIYFALVLLSKPKTAMIEDTGVGCKIYIPEEVSTMNKHVLFLCTGNSCRSQMAEAIVNHDLADTWQAYSAGTQPAGYTHPLAIKALTEIGITHQGESKSVEPFKDFPLDCVVTVCGDARENCPVWLGEGKRVHIGFEDPAKAEGDEDARYAVFVRVRDEIRAQVVEYLKSWKEGA